MAARLHSSALFLLHQFLSTVPLNVRAERETSTLLRKQGESEAFHAHGSQTTERVKSL